jgi:hypothetical protein
MVRDMARSLRAGCTSLIAISALTGGFAMAGCSNAESAATREDMRKAEKVLQVIMLENAWDESPYEARVQVCEDFRRDSSYAIAQFMKSGADTDFEWSWSVVREVFEKKCY